ncbi:hypothetical protein XBP1_1920002 [Xenorhabdus bovienii str. puntauvense]|uniref:Uncharacterized protein n=1 Tax=Xenorhabdus bovienii str. puntauvense TaxID=1398201 RepID=A0A077NCN7_XENBV|nr:hypothetical protein XBP1_1920002 [Xenorhabdus bovienii str. puntauvense]
MPKQVLRQIPKTTLLKNQLTQDKAPSYQSMQTPQSHKIGKHLQTL